MARSPHDETFRPRINLVPPAAGNGDQHVEPTFGRSHVARSDCWCHPECTADYRATGGTRVWVHHPEQ